MFEIIRPDINIDFVRLRGAALAFSAVLIVVGLGSLVAKGGPNYGIDFSGGLMVHVGFEQPVTIAEVRRATANKGFGEIQVQSFGTAANEFLLRVPAADEVVGGGRAAGIKDALREGLPDRGMVEKRTEIVGPRVGKDLRRRGVLSVLAATVMMGLYIAIRFQLRFGIGAAAALLHDVVITLGTLSLTNVEIDLSVVAALLTVVGYSVNDTVVVSDRIRENMKRFRKEPLRALINRSVNDTLSRTVLTGVTTLLVLSALFFFGGGVIRGFAFTLIVGLTVGTYSSIFIAAPIVERWGAPQGTAS